MVILGIDPGTAITGYGIIRSRKLLKCLGFGTIETKPTLTSAERLKELYNKLTRIVRKHRPKVIAVEDIFFFKNLKTAVTVSQAKGVILLLAAKLGIPVFEYTPLQVKMAITGFGRADKQQVQRMIRPLLGLRDVPRPDDAADALAVAVCCANFLKSRYS